VSDTFFTGYTCAAGGEIMNITILNGSSKGDMSVTMQYARFFREEFPEHRFIQLNIAQKLGKFEKNPEYEQEVYRSISSSDLVLFFYPLYYLTVHSQTKREERNQLVGSISERVPGSQG
jgi:FMN-dependent NADH-azoreductase